MLEPFSQQPVYRDEAHQTIINSGTAPFCFPFIWTINVSVQQENPTTGQYSLQVFIVVYEANNSYTYQSEMVSVQLGSTTPVPFPVSGARHISRDSYGVSSIKIQCQIGETIHPHCVGVFIGEGQGGAVANLVETEVTPVWIIGARDIAIIDDPLPICTASAER